MVGRSVGLRGIGGQQRGTPSIDNARLQGPDVGCVLTDGRALSIADLKPATPTRGLCAARKVGGGEGSETAMRAWRRGLQRDRRPAAGVVTQSRDWPVGAPAWGGSTKHPVLEGPCVWSREGEDRRSLHSGPALAHPPPRTAKPRRLGWRRAVHRDARPIARRCQEAGSAAATGPSLPGRRRERAVDRQTLPGTDSPRAKGRRTRTAGRARPTAASPDDDIDCEATLTPAALHSMKPEGAMDCRGLLGRARLTDQGCPQQMGRPSHRRTATARR